MAGPVYLVLGLRIGRKYFLDVQVSSEKDFQDIRITRNRFVLLVTVTRQMHAKRGRISAYPSS